ncbi:MAG: hypothetical protein WAS05_05325 [Candidatus Nanopelagicales bacterium]
MAFSNARRKYGLISVAGVATCSLLASGIVVTNPGNAAPSTLNAISALPANSKADQLRAKIKAASKAVSESKEAVAASEKKLPGARAKVSEAQAKEVAARAKKREAEEQHDAALKKVGAQQKRIDAVKAEIAKIQLRIAAIARHNYISGAENQELDILLESQDPADFATGMESVRRVARSNANLFDQAEKLKRELDKQMQTLEELERAAQEKANQAAGHARQAQVMRAEAEAAKREVESLLAQQKSELANGRKLLNKVREQYDELMASLGAPRGYAKGGKGVSRSPKEAVAWAMQFVGNGAYYDNLCLKFVDDAYGATGSRVGRAIDQWYRAKAAGKAHPGDRNPPIGAQVFWWSNNDARHIALYAGGGMIISTGADYNRVGLVPWSYFDGYGPYLGWAEPYYP